mgnify:CR=1 FL=1
MPLSDIHFEQIAAAGLITLDRPEALNALSIEMVTALRERLTHWADDPSVTHIILCSSRVYSVHVIFCQCKGGEPALA